MTASVGVLLVAAANATSGGGERHVADLLRRLPEAGVAVSLACPGGGDLSALADALGILRYPVPIESGLSAAKMSAVRGAIESVRPDIVHAHGSRAAMFARVADRQAALRVVYTVHGIHIDKAGSPLRRTAFLSLERILRSRTARFITVCESDVEKGTRLGILDPARTCVVHNGVDVPPEASAQGIFRAELGIGSGAPLVLSIGRFHEQKDQLALLRAWRSVLDRVPEAVLALVGSGGLEGRLREASVANALGDSLRFVAPRTDLGPAYRDADIFVLSSLWEGLPYVVLEAMANALPVVSTNVDGIPEAVVDGETGLLTPAGDSPALAEALLELLDDQSRSRAMGFAGRLRVEQRFSTDLMIEDTVRIYREVLGRD